jgi:hypothetical protein
MAFAPPVVVFREFLMSKLSDTLHGLAVELGAESPLDEGTTVTPGAAAVSSAASAPVPATRVPAGSGGAPSAAAAPEVAASSAYPSAAGLPVAAEHEYAIYTSAGRIYIQDATGKVIGLGDLMEEAHIYRYELDEGGISGDGFPDLGSALRDLSAHVTFAYIDGLFRSQIDVADEASLHSMSVPAIRLRLTPGAA